MTPTGRLGFRGRALSLEERSHVLDELFFEGDRRHGYLVRYVVLIVFSSGIAAFGLINDSAAVVIGAMLIAPLMTPIMAVASALVQTWTRRVWESLAIVAGGAALAIAVGWLIGALLPTVSAETVLPAEIIGRTSPNLVDLGIALLAGAAGAFVTVRREAGSALPGVGIAVALIPPLATVGVTLGIGRTELSGGALLLFLTNLAAIILAAGMTFAITGFVPPAGRLKNRRWSVAAAVLLVLLLVGPLTANTIPQWEEDEYAAEAARRALSWNPDLEVEAVIVDATKMPVLFELTVSGPEPPDDPTLLAEALALAISEPVRVEVLYLPKSAATATARRSRSGAKGRHQGSLGHMTAPPRSL